MKKILYLLALLLLPLTAAAEDGTAAPLRRLIDQQHPAWFVHIDTWNWPDPQKIIELIPEDIRPYCVMNISLSISHDTDTGDFTIVRDGYHTAESWVRTCAENKMWCMIQPASGAYSHLPDGDMTLYREFYERYPNFLGFNYCEQFWGFEDSDPHSVTVMTRLNHFAKLMGLAKEYGGYLAVSWCGGIWHWNSDPIAMMKRCPDFCQACQDHPENFILMYKYTTNSCWYNNESVCFGPYVSGLVGNYGIRFDQCGWQKADNEKYPTAAGIGTVLDQTAMNGASVFDGPELIWQQDFKEDGTYTDASGFKSRKWARYPQMDDIWIDYYRKIIDGTIRIPDYDDIIARTKVAVFADINSGNAEAQYAMPPGIYDGLYKQDGEGNLQENKYWFKKTGRYPALAMITAMYNDKVRNIPIRVRKSQVDSRWGTVQAKVNEINKYCPQEYTGNIFAARNENTWVVYYPYRYTRTAKGNIPFKYNTAESMDLQLGEYTGGIVREYTDHVSFYLNNFRVDTTNVKTDIIKINGSTVQPTMTYKNRGRNNIVISDKWEDGVYTVTLRHNGPVDIDIACHGDATDRLTDYKPSIALPGPEGPAYYGIQQYESECFDTRDIARVVTNGVGQGIEGYTGQGYLNMGNSAKAAVRDTIRVPVAGSYKVSFHYSAPNNDVKNYYLYVKSLANNARRGSYTFAKTANAGDWQTASLTVDLPEGKFPVYLRALSSGQQGQLYIDNMTIEPLFDAEAAAVAAPNANAAKAVGTIYYNVSGQRVANPRGGLFIQRTTMSDGTVRTRKVRL